MQKLNTALCYCLLFASSLSSFLRLRGFSYYCSLRRLTANWLGTINVIFAAPGRTGSCPSKVLSVARLSSEDINQDPKKAKVEIPLVMGFSDEDKIGTIQPHDDALVITLRIGGYDVKRVMVDQGSAIEIMYFDLYKGLNLKPRNLTPYSSPLVSFEGKIIIPKGQIRLPVQTGSEVVKVDFIIVDAYSPCTAIVARP